MTDKSRLLILKFWDKVKGCVDILPAYLRRDYDALGNKLREVYGVHISDRVYYAELMNRKKEMGKSAITYMHDIQRLVRKQNVHPSQRDTRNAFLNGLPPKMLTCMGPKQGKSANEMLQTAMYYEELSKKIDTQPALSQPQGRGFNTRT